MKWLDLKEYMWSLYDQLESQQEKDRFYDYWMILLKHKLPVGQCYQQIRALYHRFNEEKKYLDSYSRAHLNQLKSERERYYFLQLNKKQNNQYTHHQNPPSAVANDTACLSKLGLSYPCVESDIKKAYRQLAKQYHPDFGGNQSQFIELKKAYFQALEIYAS